MKREIIFFILILTVFSSGVLFGKGKKEDTPAVTAEVEEKAPEKTTASEEAAEPEYTDSQNKLAALGFQLPLETFEAPDFTVQTLDGKEVSLSDYKGKVIFLNFWATWCGPCQAEMPSMEVLFKKLPKNRFAMLAVNVNEQKETVQSYISENGYIFPILLDTTGEISAMYQVQGIPTTWMIDSNGTVLGRLVGTTEWDTPQMFDTFDFLLKNN